MSDRLVSATVQEVSDGYPELERIIASRIESNKLPLFTTASSPDLYSKFLEALPDHRRQHYTCNCCRNFVDKYGGLVTIASETGVTHSLLWDTNLDYYPEFFRMAVNRMRPGPGTLSQKVTGVFLSSEEVWGTPISKGLKWTHLSGKNPDVYSHALKTASQAMAEKLEDFLTLVKGLGEYSMEAVEQAVRVLKADAVSGSEKALGVAEWLLNLQQTIQDKRGTLKTNLIWLAVAMAPPGFCHIRSTMISTLLDDILAGLPFATIQARWAAKMHPLQYQRPTTVKQGNILQAEKIVATLKSEGSLDRRFAKISDILVALWTPASKPEVDEKALKKPGNVFGHIIPSDQKRNKVSPIELPTVTMTWTKFQREILPEALEIEFLPPGCPSPFYGMVTAVNPEAPPILQWDGLTGPGFTEGSVKQLYRNPVSWYFYHRGSMPEHWGLVSGQWVKVMLICEKPPRWQQPDKFKHVGEGVFLVLEGCKDLHHESGGGFFPESLRSEYHEIRSVMESYANKARIQGKEEGEANGYALQKESHRDGRSREWSCKLRIKTKDGIGIYNLDRWD